MAGVVGLAIPGGPTFVDALRRVWDDGDAAAPLDPRLPRGAQQRMLATLAPGSVIDEYGERTQLSGSALTDAGDALVVPTSGTTGEPKGVVLTHDAVEASARATSARLGVDPGQDQWLACLPLSHVGGLSVVTRALVTRTALVVQPGFDAAAVARAGDEGATLVSLVPTALRRVDPDAFRTILLGGSRPPIDRPDNVVTTYGMTETGSGIVYDGKPLDGVDVAIDAGHAIRVKGPMLLRAYRDGVDPRDDDGWLDTGDMGRWDGDRLVVEGREDDLIITGGENVWPEPVEELLTARPDVSEVAVTGRDDPEWGQRVVAHVVPADPGTPPALDELRATVTEALPPWNAPKELVLESSLPRTGSGKVHRAGLR
jgi:O-succinylbenzoic acid--CoA ligase